MGGRLIAPHIPPAAEEEWALVRCALRLLVGYVGGAIFVLGLLHLAGSVGTAWHALAFLTAGAALAGGGVAGAWVVLRDADHRRAIGEHYRQGRARRPAMPNHSLGRRVG